LSLAPEWVARVLRTTLMFARRSSPWFTLGMLVLGTGACHSTESAKPRPAAASAAPDAVSAAKQAPLLADGRLDCSKNVTRDRYWIRVEQNGQSETLEHGSKLALTRDGRFCGPQGTRGDEGVLVRGCANQGVPTGACIFVSHERIIYDDAAGNVHLLKPRNLVADLKSGVLEGHVDGVREDGSHMLSVVFHVGDDVWGDVAPGDGQF